MFPDSSQIFASPEFHCIGVGKDRAQFVRMERRHYQESVFLDRRLSALDMRPIDVPLAPLMAEAETNEGASVKWIFHVAHCGSTLLANLLDQPGRSLVLREPPTLRQIGLERSAGAPDSQVVPRMKLAHRLAARRFVEAEPVLVKANVPVNFCLDLLGNVAGDEPAIALYLNWRDYLLAILRTDNHRAWLLRISGTFRRQIEQATGLPLGSTTPERAAALWLTQMRFFQDLVIRNPKAVALDAERLSNDPVAIATAAAGHLGLSGVEPSANAAMIGTYSKDPSRAFDGKDRQQRKAADLLRLAEELALAEQWLAQAADVGAIRLGPTWPEIGE